MTDLRQYWPTWLEDDLRTEVEAAYADPGRGYHDLTHLAEAVSYTHLTLPTTPYV